MTEPDQNQLRLYLSGQHDCAYLPGMKARSLVIDPEARMTPPLYGMLLEHGFRRSGGMVYRPRCQACSDCIPVRIPVPRFQPRRAQRRVWKKHRGVVVRAREPRFLQEHYELYARYILDRHPDGEMADVSEEKYMAFLACDWCATHFVEFRQEDGRLLAVAVTDLLPRGLSAVYTFFEPACSHLSPGVLSVLWQIQAARELGLSWLYLGYWVPGCRKMSYKEEYRPIQTLAANQWQEAGRGEPILM
jgi:arginine-tRNA-protein transferase